MGKKPKKPHSSIKPIKTQKNPLGWAFLKKNRVFKPCWIRPARCSKTQESYCVKQTVQKQSHARRTEEARWDAEKRAFFNILDTQVTSELSPNH